MDDFFNKVLHSAIRNEGDICVEYLYQRFKARLMEEVCAKGPEYKVEGSFVCIGKELPLFDKDQS